MIELEKKILLTEEIYEQLLESFGKDGDAQRKPIVRQVNYYFDTEDLAMNRHGITCRIRLKNGKYTGTIKRHVEGSDRSVETEIQVRNGIYDNDFIDMGLRLQGELITDRCVILKNSTCEAVLDKNEYLGVIDYELEIEYAPDCEKNVQELLKVLFDTLNRGKIISGYEDFYPQIVPVSAKSSRFFKRKSTINQ